MSKRVHNFYAGPATLPLPALERARAELLDFQGTGMSVMEISHRSKAYEAVHNEAQSLLRELLGVPDTHTILFLQGGASLQFAMLPMNFLKPGERADYVLTGEWAVKAHKEARRFGEVRAIASSEDRNWSYLPEFEVEPGARYLHLTSNNTVEGTEYHTFPDTGGMPLVADMSSDMLWRKFDVTRFALIYAGAQKNLGPAGLTLVIVRNDFLGEANPDVPTMLQYGVHAKHNSLYNTPPCFSIYMLRNVLSWLRDEVGGLDAIERRNRDKAQLVYDAIDSYPDFYRGTVGNKEHRSVMNLTWRLPSEELEIAFCKEAEARGLIGLKGHRSVGGIRASLYNALGLDAVEALVAFMTEFARKAPAAAAK